MLEEILGVGVIRQRYPIMPVYCEGSSLSKKINAIEAMLEENKRNAKPATKPYSTGVSSNSKKHTHIINIAITDYDNLIANPGTSLEIKTEYTRDHAHKLTLKYDSDDEAFHITGCDSSSDGAYDSDHFCWDGHQFKLLTSN